MKKKIVTLLLLSTLAFSGCGNFNVQSDTSLPDTEVAQTETTAEESTEVELSELDSLGDVEIDKNILTVDLTIPADFVGENTQDDLNQLAEEKGYNSITLNEDGSATYVMTKAKHKEMMEEITNNINSSLNEMIGSEDYPNFTDIKANSDFTEFTITTTSTELDLAESFSVMAFYTYGGMYNIFNGTPVDNIHVDFVNADSGEIISSSDSSDTADAE